MRARVSGTPLNFPQRGEIRPDNTALFIIDMQHDFCSEVGYMAGLGADMALLSAPIAPIARTLAAARAWGCHVIHTREGYAADLSDLQPWKQAGEGDEGHGIGKAGPRGRALIRDEPGWNIIDALQPLSGEPVYDKSSYGVFATTGIDEHLRDRGVENIVLTGVTTDCCVTSCLREALDRGYDCLVLEDCIATSSLDIHNAALAVMKKPGGVFGTTSMSDAFIDFVQQPGAA